MRTASHLLASDVGRQPPGPHGVPWFGSYFSVLSDPIRLFCDGRDRYGDIVRYRFGPFRFVVVNDPDAIQHLFVKNHRNYTKSRSYAGLRLVMGNGLVTSEGEFWRRQRKLSQPAFHRQRLAKLVDKMVECTNEMLDDWDRRASPEIDVHEQMMRLTLRIVGHSLFSTELSHDAGELGPAITIAMRRANKYAEAAVRLPLWLPTPLNLRFAKARGLLDATIQRIIDERRAHGRDMGDVLSMLMAATDESGEERMTDQQLRDEVMTLFLAGHETIATAMSWTWKLLSEHPEAATRLREEARSVLGGSAPTFESLAKLEYTGRVVDEAMRLYPPVWIFERAAIDDDEIAGFHIPKQTIVGVCTWALHRHPALWNDPQRFDPDRFLPENSADRHKYAYLPFGAGPRICIGNNFALMEAKVLLATMAQRYAIDVPDSHAIGYDPGVTLRPAPNMPARLRRL